MLPIVLLELTSYFNPSKYSVMTSTVLAETNQQLSYEFEVWRVWYMEHCVVGIWLSEPA